MHSPHAHLLRSAQKDGNIGHVSRGMHRYCAYRTGGAQNNSDDLKNYPEIELKWSKPGIAFRVTFKKKNYTPESAEKTRVKTREKILSILKATPYITINELAEIVGISQKGVEWQIVKLKKEGRIKRSDTAKADTGKLQNEKRERKQYNPKSQKHTKRLEKGEVGGNCSNKYGTITQTRIL